MELWNDIELDDTTVLDPHFDPKDFDSKEQELTISNNQLDHEKLLTMANKVSKLRNIFLSKAANLNYNHKPKTQPKDTSRSRKGIKYSERQSKFE